MKMLQQVHHFIVHPHVLTLPPSDALHATIAAEAIEAAKGGHTVSLALPTGDPVLVAPHDRLGDVTAKVADALSPTGGGEVTEQPPPRGKGKKGSTDEV